MADQKLFAGPRIRRARQELGLTQSAMAASLGISPSYLNLIERNQRPLTAQVLMALSGAHGIDVSEFAGGGGEELAGLREAFSDPLLSGETTGPRELIDMADTAPAASAGVAKLYRAYREALSRLSDLSDALAEPGVVMSATLAAPADRFRAIVEARPHHFPDLDEAAERVAAILPKRSERGHALAEWLEDRGWSIRGMPAADMPYWRVHADRHAKRLYLSDAMGAAERLVALAAEAMRWAEPDAIRATEAAMAGEGESPDVTRLLSHHVRRAAGRALAMPYRRFHEEAQRMGFDATTLAARYRVDVGHAAWRLASLNRINESGPPFVVLVVDGAGHTSLRVGARGFPAALHGPCPRLPAHALAQRSGAVRVDRLETPDGTRYAAWSYGLPRASGGAVMLALPESDAEPLTVPASAPIPIGPSCRLCERRGCPARIEPPVTRPTVVDEWKRGPTLWEFE